jgi:hypothetical protein
MAYEMKPDTGSLFKNDRREKDTHANARGSALIGGVEYWVDAWTNETSSGDKYQSLKFKRKDAQGGGGSAPRSQSAAFDTDLDDDVPFMSCDPALEARVR